MPAGRPPIDLRGKRFGRLTVLEKAGSRPPRGVYWLCRCDCGKEKIIDGAGLRQGSTHSCGCLAVEGRQTRRREVQQRKTEIALLRTKGASFLELAKRYGVSKQRIHQMLNEAIREEAAQGDGDPASLDNGQLALALRDVVLAQELLDHQPACYHFALVALHREEIKLRTEAQRRGMVARE